MEFTDNIITLWGFRHVLGYNFIGMPEPRTKLLQIKMSPVERKELDALARTKGLSASAMVRLLVREACDRMKSKN